MPTTHHPNGVTNVDSATTLGDFVSMDPTKVHQVFDDFNTYTAAAWTVTSVGAATQALTDISGGALLITNAAADDNSSFLQKVGESFLLTAGKKTWMKARFKVSDATQSDVVIGLQVTDTTPLAVTDGIYFLKTDGAATLDLIVRKDETTGSTSATAIATLVSDTFITVGWQYDGIDKVTYFINDVAVGTLSASSTYLPDTELTVSFGVQNGEAVAKTFTIDYFFAAQER